MHLIPVWYLPHEVSGVRQPERNRVLAAQVQVIFIEWDGFVHGISNAAVVQTNAEVRVGNRLCDSKLTTLVSFPETELNSSNLFHIEGGN